MSVRKYPLLVLFLVSFYAVTTHFHLHDYFTDYFGRGPVIQKIAEMPLHSLHLKIFSTQHPFGPIPYNYDFYTWLLAMIVKFSGLNPFLPLQVAGLFNFVLLALSLHLFLKEYYSDSQLSLYMLPVMLFFCGKSWDFSGAYDIGAQIMNLTCPSSFAFALSFLALGFFVKYLRKGTIKNWIGLAILWPVILLTNLLSAFFLLGTMTVLFICERRVTLKNVLSFILLFVVTGFIASSWPYFSFLKLLKEGFALQSIFDPTYYFHPEHLLRLGPALLGIPIVFYYTVQKRELLVIFGFLLFFLSFLAAFALANPMGWRILFFITFFLHLGIALYLRKTLPGLGKPFILTRANSPTALFVGVFITCLLYQTISTTAKELGYHSFKEALHFVQNNEKRGLGFEKRFQFLKQYVSPNTKVLSDQDTSLIIATFGGSPVLDRGSYYDPFMISLNEKKKELQEFFGIQTPLQRRLEIIKNCQAQYVLWNSERVSGPLPEDLKRLGQVLYQNGPLTLIKIDS